MYSYYDFYKNYYEAYYDSYYEYYYWPYYYASYYNESVANYTHNGTYPPSAYKYPWKYDYHTAGISIYTFSWVMLIITALVFFAAIYRLYEERVTKKKKTNVPSLVAVVLCLLLHLLTNIFDTIFEHYWWMDYPGWDEFVWIWKTWNVLVLMSKVSLYIVYIGRFYLIFRAAALTNENFKRDRRIFVTFYALLVITAIVLESIWINWEYGAEYNISEQTTKYMRFAFTIIDIVFMVSIVCLIIKCILDIVALQSENTHSTTTSQDTRPSTKAEKDLSSYMENNKETKTVEMNEMSASSPSAAADSKMSVASKSNSDVSISTNGTITRSTRKHMDKNVKLMHMVTKIALTCIIAVISSFFYNFTHSWKYFDSPDAGWIVWTWALDITINIITVYLSMGSATHDYKKICYDWCRCHQCCLKIILRVIPRDVRDKMSQKEFTL